MLKNNLAPVLYKLILEFFNFLSTLRERIRQKKRIIYCVTYKNRTFGQLLYTVASLPTDM